MQSSPDLPSLDRAKFLTMAKTLGLSQAITALHHEMWRLEHVCFEGKAGWNPALYEKIKEYRNFSVELWNGRYDSEH